VAELAAAYDFLRRVEHRLQYLDDAQTHMLPTGDADRAIIARAMGYGSFDGLLAELDDHRAAVARHFEAVFADPNRGEHKHAGMWRGAGGEDQGEEFAKLGYRQPREAAARVAALREGPRYQQFAAGIRERFDALVPQLIQAAAEMPNPDATLSRSLDLLEAISRRAAYLALLQQYPQALRKVAELVSSSSWAADYLQRHPILLDELLDPRLLDVLPDWSGVRAGSWREAGRAGAGHRAADGPAARDPPRPGLPPAGAGRGRPVHGGEARRPSFRTGRHPARRRPAPRLAEAAQAPCRGAEVRRHQLRQARRQGTRLRLRPRPGLPLRRPAPEAGENYGRLGTRLNTWLSAQTAAGQLFETDLRLRPNGESGLVVSSMESFRKYQLESAWVWEHQALTRARFSAGDPAVGEAFEKIRCEVLCQQRDLEKLRADIVEMRQKMMDSHATRGDLRETVFDLKHDPGGLVDVEFIVQYLVLGHSHAHPNSPATRATSPC
jgi:glutamate-ammonia-ligase adenylyltransferase